MILVNEKELNLTVPFPDENSSPEDIARFKALTYNEQWAAEKLAEIVRIKEIRIVNPNPLNKQQLARKVPNSFDVSGKVRNPKTGIEEHWKYSNTPPTIIGDKRIYRTFHYGFFHSEVITSEKNTELIFFLLNILKHKDRKYIIENKEADAMIKNAKRKIKSQVEYWIFTKSTEEDIKRLALRWMIADIDNKTDSELRDEIMSIIEINEAKQDSKKGFASFIKEMESDSDFTRIASYFMNEIQKKTISFNPSARTCFWTGATEFIGGIIPPARMADKEEYMIQYLIDHPEEKDLFLSAVTDDKLIELNNDYTLITHVKKLQSWAKKNLGDTFPNTAKLAEGMEWIKNFKEKQNADIENKTLEPVE
jgi:hypothetical protein